MALQQRYSKPQEPLRCEFSSSSPQCNYIYILKTLSCRELPKNFHNSVPLSFDHHIRSCSPEEVPQQLQPQGRTCASRITAHRPPLIFVGCQAAANTANNRMVALQDLKKAGSSPVSLAQFATQALDLQA